MKNFREYRENVRDLLVGESNKEERHKLLEKIKTHSEYQDAEKEQALDRKNFGQIRKYLQDFVDKKYKVLADQAKKDAIGWQIPFALRVIAHTEDYELGLPKEGVDYFLDFYAGRVKGEIKTGKYGRDGYYSSREEQELPKVVPEGKGEFEHSPKGKVLYPTSEESAILKTKIERQKYLSKEVLDIFSSEEGIDKLNKALEDAMNNGLEAVGMYQSIYSDYAKLFKVTPEELKELFPINREKAKICASKLINSFYFERAEETIKFFELENDEDLEKKMKQKKEQWEKTKEAVVKNLPKVIERKGLYMFSDQPHSHFDVETPYGAVHGKCWYSGKKNLTTVIQNFYSYYEEEAGDVKTSSLVGGDSVLDLPKEDLIFFGEKISNFRNKMKTGSLTEDELRLVGETMSQKYAGDWTYLPGPSIDLTGVDTSKIQYEDDED